jgi:hypothetical protein
MIFIFIYSCKEKQQDKVISNQKENNVVKKDTLQEIIQIVIDDKRMDIYHNYLSENEKFNIVLIEDEKLGISKEMKIYKFNHFLQIVSYDSIKNKTKANYFDITKIDYFKDSLYVSYYYKLENIECQTYFIKKNNLWKQGDTRIVRY